MKTLTVEQPVQIIHGYVPVVEVPTSEWGINRASELHGDGRQISENTHIVLCTDSHKTPPGAWIFTYEFDADGVSGVRTFVAAKIATR